MAPFALTEVGQKTGSAGARFSLTSCDVILSLASSCLMEARVNSLSRKFGRFSQKPSGANRL